MQEDPREIGAGSKSDTSSSINSTTSRTNEGRRRNETSNVARALCTTGNSHITGLLDICDYAEGPTLEVYGGEESLMPSRMRRSLTSILSCTGVKCAWKALPRPPIAVAARPLEAVAATLGCGGATCERIFQLNICCRSRTCY